MGVQPSLKEYYKYDFAAFLIGFGGSVWGGPTYFLGIPVVLLTFLNASSFQIGLVTAIFWAGFSFPQIWAAYQSECLLVKKRFIAAVLVLSSLGFLAYGLYILFTGLASYHSLNSWLFLLAFLWACSLAGLYIPPNFTLLFKIIPTARLGKLLGVYFAAQYGGLFLSGFFIDRVNLEFAAPVNFAVLFLVTFVITIFTAGIILSLREPEGEVVQTHRVSFGSYLVRFFELYRDSSFRQFLVAKWLMSGHYVMQAFLLAYLLKFRGFEPSIGGWFPALNALGLAAGGFTLTRIADRYGPKYLLIVSQFIAIFYTFLIWYTPQGNTSIVFLAFAATGLTQISDNVGYTNQCLLLCPQKDKSTYVAATNVGMVPFMVLLPMAVGRLMDLNLLTFDGVVYISLFLMTSAILYLFAVLKNPASFVDLKLQSMAGGVD